MQTYQFGGFLLDTKCYRLYKHSESVLLEPKTMELLIYLIHHKDRVVTKDELLDKLCSVVTLSTMCYRAPSMNSVKR